MSIIGVGVDIVNNNRFKKLVKKKIFIQRIFTLNEQKSSNKIKNKINFTQKDMLPKKHSLKQQDLEYQKTFILKILK